MAPQVKITKTLSLIVSFTWGATAAGMRNYWPGWTLLVAPPVGEESDDELADDFGPEG